MCEWSEPSDLCGAERGDVSTFDPNGITPGGKKAIYMQHGINARAYVPVTGSLQPSKLCTVERLGPPCGATIVRACQSVETSNSRLSHTQLSGYVILVCRFALIEAPKGDGEPPAARARNDSMGGSESQFLGDMTSPNGNGLCGGWTMTRSSCCRWR